jgi:hypothetical protein
LLLRYTKICRLISAGGLILNIVELSIMLIVLQYKGEPRKEILINSNG